MTDRAQTASPPTLIEAPAIGSPALDPAPAAKIDAIAALRRLGRPPAPRWAHIALTNYLSVFLMARRGVRLGDDRLAGAGVMRVANWIAEPRFRAQHRAELRGLLLGLGVVPRDGSSLDADARLDEWLDTLARAASTSPTSFGAIMEATP